jgi:hypothetical protein
VTSYVVLGIYGTVAVMAIVAGVSVLRIHARSVERREPRSSSVPTGGEAVVAAAGRQDDRFDEAVMRGIAEAIGSQLSEQVRAAIGAPAFQDVVRRLAETAARESFHDAVRLRLRELAYSANFSEFKVTANFDRHLSFYVQNMVAQRQGSIHLYGHGSQRFLNAQLEAPDSLDEELASLLETEPGNDDIDDPRGVY